MGGKIRVWTLGAVRLLAAAALSLAAPIAAQAATITFTVQNPSGTLQSGVGVYYVPGYPYTSPYGQVTISGLTPGQQIAFSRDTSPGCTAPEGSPGQWYTVPDPAPANATITLPSSNGPPAESGLSSSERGEIGLINEERVRSGLAPLEISTAMSDAADRYSNFLVTSGVVLGSDPSNHCLLGSPMSRLADVGYPLPYSYTGGEILSDCGSAYGAFNCWRNSVGHWANIHRSSFRVVGVGRVGGTWTVNFLSACTTGCERAGLTGDYGDSSLADGDPSDGLGTDAQGPGAKCAVLSGAARKKCIRKAIRKCKRKKSPRAVKKCIRRVRKNVGTTG